MEKVPVIFLPVPNSLKKDVSFFHDRDEKQEAVFHLDPSIQIPVELHPNDNNLDSNSISWEKIVSGMLRIISAPGEYDIPPEWVDYYKRFVLTVKPEIYHEFTGASIVKAKNGEFNMALEISSVLEGLFPGSPGVLLNKALILENRAAAMEKNGHETLKENAEALEAYETALSLEPLLPDVLFNAGFFFRRLGEYKRAKECFSRYALIAEEAENSNGIPVELPEEKLNQAKKIVLDINSQGLDDSNFIEAYNCINNGDDEKGLSKIHDFLQKHPKAWNGWFVLGWALRKLGRYSDSLESLRKAHEHGGRSLDLKNETAICLMELGDLKQAQKELEQALREEPENIKIISNLGVLAMKTGDKAKAASYFRFVLELDPADPVLNELGMRNEE